jgi:hypothetical protein
MVPLEYGSLPAPWTWRSFQSVMHVLPLARSLGDTLDCTNITAIVPFLICALQAALGYFLHAKETLRPATAVSVCAGTAKSNG